MAALAFGAHALALSRSASAGVAVVLAGVAAACDLGLGGLRVPGHIRQVNEDWLVRYRSWVYGAGFGYQVGTGVATYTMTAGLYLMIGLAALTASPLAAVAICTSFGLVRGCAVLPVAGMRTPASLREKACRRMESSSVNRRAADRLSR